MSFEYKKFSSGYKEKFERMKRNILDLSGLKLEVEHVGSTSIKGLGGKGVIDMLIGIKKWSEAKELLKVLRKIGFKHFHDIENHSLFVSTKASSEEGDFHVHISKVGTKRYLRTLAFRDCLRNNPNKAREYSEMKKEAFKKCKGNRKRYKRFKNQWFSDLACKEIL